MHTVKPFVKWAGGKRHLLKQLDALLPNGFENLPDVTYIEPFVGGGSILFHMLSKYKNIRRVVINDINPDLINCYYLIKDSPYELLECLKKINSDFYGIGIERRSELYYKYRLKYNTGNLSEVDKAAIFLFLNHTCYNGLYRVNSKGEFNVPYGKYKNPMIFNEEAILLDHEILNSIELIILNGEYQGIANYFNGNDNNFIYLDPPYRPLSVTSSFREYSVAPFGDNEQENLKEFCDYLGQNNASLMVSNSDSLNEDGSSYFENLYQGYNFHRILVHRFINATKGKRPELSEVLIRNY